MGICHPEILRTEKFGSREKQRVSNLICQACGKTISDWEPVCDITGNLFCGSKCKNKSFNKRVRRVNNDQEGT